MAAVMLVYIQFKNVVGIRPIISKKYMQLLLILELLKFIKFIKNRIYKIYLKLL